MKVLKYIIITIASATLTALPISAQESGRKSDGNWQERVFLQYYIQSQGDTVYVDELAPAFVFPKFSRKERRNSSDLRKYYKLVYNFNAVYPYTGVARNTVRRADSLMAGMNRIQRERYVNKVQDQLLDDFKEVARNMTISQGQLLCRLVDREIGKSSYDIVKDYKSGLAARFWQGVAKAFHQDLKSKYDPEGEDRMTEYLIEKWDEGQFDALYFSLFDTWPKKVEIPSKYR